VSLVRGEPDQPAVDDILQQLHRLQESPKPTGVCLVVREMQGRTKPLRRLPQSR